MNTFKTFILIFLLAGLMAIPFLYPREKDAPREEEPKPQQVQTVRIFAASSFAHVLKDARERIEAETGLELSISEAASSILARQIENGAPADLFITANVEWMNYLDLNGFLTGRPVEIARNRLVFASHNPEALGILGITPRDYLAEGNMFITGDPSYVPLGTYALEVLESMNFEENIRENLIPAANAREALRMLEAKGALLGILYRTDALSSGNVDIYENIPSMAHRPVTYWAAPTDGLKPAQKRALMDFLKSEAFLTILESKGFEVRQEVNGNGAENSSPGTGTDQGTP